MNRIVLHEIPFHMTDMYQDHACEALDQAKTEAANSPPVRWALNNSCHVKITTTSDDTTGLGSIVYYAALTPMQQIEFALRFSGVV